MPPLTAGLGAYAKLIRSRRQVVHVLDAVLIYAPAIVAESRIGLGIGAFGPQAGNQLRDLQLVRVAVPLETRTWTADLPYGDRSRLRSRLKALQEERLLVARVREAPFHDAISPNLLEHSVPVPRSLPRTRIGPFLRASPAAAGETLPGVAGGKLARSTGAAGPRGARGFGPRGANGGS